jgi:hypothetical protein
MRAAQARVPVNARVVTDEKRVVVVGLEARAEVTRLLAGRESPLPRSARNPSLPIGPCPRRRAVTEEAVHPKRGELRQNRCRLARPVDVGR